MDYKNAKIYTVRSHQTDLVYVGSTCSPLHKRFHQHKQKSGNNLKVSSQAIMKFEDAYIELYEEFPCDNVQQLRKQEGEVICSMNCVNKNIAGQTHKEYQEHHKEDAREYNKKWLEANKEHHYAMCKKCV